MSKVTPSLDEERKEKVEHPWGPIIYTPWTQTDEFDPIQQLINEYETIKNEKWMSGTKEEFDEDKKKRLAEKNREIYDAIKFKKMKTHQ